MKQAVAELQTSISPWPYNQPFLREYSIDPIRDLANYAKFTKAKSYQPECENVNRQVHLRHLHTQTVTGLVKSVDLLKKET